MSRGSKLPGSKVSLGEIKVGKHLGEGGFGVVHEATIAGIEFPFAIKFLDPHPFNSEGNSARERFFREAELLFKLRHPRIIAIYGVGEHEGRPYILMERFDGLDLHKAREKHGAPNPDVVLPFVEYIADGLGHAHLKEIIHRDIKPRNLMTVRGDARVLDFGVASVLDPDGSRLTRTGGTWTGDAFSAPELIDNPKLRDGRCDVYSLGACWFWLLTGKTPKGLNWEGALRSAVKVSPDYERVVLRCLEQVDSRYATMQELVAEVRSLRAGEKPRAGVDSLTDDDVLVLGVIASACSAPGDQTTFYQVEQELKGSMSRLAIGISNRRLVRLELVTTSTHRDWDGDSTTYLSLSTSGEEWTEGHQQQIAARMERIQPAASPTPTVTVDDDIPF